MRCVVEQRDDDQILTEEYNPQTQYYQWVTFVFAIQVALKVILYKKLKLFKRLLYSSSLTKFGTCWREG